MNDIIRTVVREIMQHIHTMGEIIESDNFKLTKLSNGSYVIESGSGYMVLSAADVKKFLLYTANTKAKARFMAYILGSKDA